MEWKAKTYFKSWTYPKTILTTRYIVHPTEYPLVQNETTLLAVPLKATNWKKVFRTSISLLSLMSLFYSGSLRTFAKMPLISRKNPAVSTFFLANGSNLPFLSDYHDGSCFTFYPQALFDKKEENEP